MPIDPWVGPLVGTVPVMGNPKVVHEYNYELENLLDSNAFPALFHLLICFYI